MLGNAAPDRTHAKSHLDRKALEQGANFSLMASRSIGRAAFWEACRKMQPLAEAMQNHTFAPRRWNRRSTFPKVLQEQLCVLPFSILVGKCIS